MRNKVKTIFLSTAFCFSVFSFYGQEHNLPEPMAEDTNTYKVPGEECADGYEGPVGFCMPINDYLFPLLIAGSLLGAYKVHRIQNCKINDFEN